MPSYRYAAVILDLDGTLLHSNAVAPQCVNGTLAEFGLPEHPPEALQWRADWRSEPLWTALLPTSLLKN
jgi:phosphoglycolate phosphatase-like HAD superfamily hydrolase